MNCLRAENAGTSPQTALINPKTPCDPDRAFDERNLVTHFIDLSAVRSDVMQRTSFLRLTKEMKNAS